MSGNGVMWSLCNPREPGRQGLLLRNFLVNLGLEPPWPRSPASSTTCAWSIATTSAAPADHPGRENTRSPATSVTWHCCSMRGDTAGLAEHRIRRKQALSGLTHEDDCPA